MFKKLAASESNKEIKEMQLPFNLLQNASLAREEIKAQLIKIDDSLNVKRYALENLEFRNLKAK
jgi:hypothetical protein